MTEWQTMQMRDVMLGFFDGPHATPPPADSGPVFLGIKNITEGGALDLSQIRHIAEDDFSRWTRRVTPEPGDVVFSYEATLHRYALIPGGFRGCLGRRLALIRPDRSVVHPRFLHLAMLGPAWRTAVTERVISGATVDRIPIANFEQFPISVPDLATQEAVVAVLGAIDDLIENNQRRVKVLEEITRAIYREWFVHFRYPGHEDATLIESPLGRIPSGWSVQSLEQCASKLVDGDWVETKDQGGDSYRLLQVSNIAVGAFRETGKYRYVTDDTFQRLRCQAIALGDILISRMPDPVGRAWLVDHLDERAITVVDVGVLTPTSPAMGHFLNQVLNSPEQLARAETVATGTTRKRITRGVLARNQIIVPNDEVLTSFHGRVESAAEIASSLRRQIRQLVRTRGLLLPKLVTGEVDVSLLELDALVDGAVA